MFLFSDGILRTCIWGGYRCFVDAQVGVLISRRKCQQMNPVYNKIVNMTKHSSHSFCYTAHRSINNLISMVSGHPYLWRSYKWSNFQLISGSRTHFCEILLNFHRSHCCRWHWCILIPELHITSIRSSRSNFRDKSFLVWSYTWSKLIIKT